MKSYLKIAAVCAATVFLINRVLQAKAIIYG